MTNKPDFNRDENELEAFLVFAMATAGKSAEVTLRKVCTFVEDVDPNGDGILSACGQIDQLGMLNEKVHEHRLGNYKRFMRFVRQAWRTNLDLATCTVSELETLHGIGPKTARFFLSFTRPGQRFAILDRHILAWLREHGVKAPKNTPTQAHKYAELERKFLALVGDGDPTQVDYQIWKSKRRECKCQSN